MRYKIYPPIGIARVGNTPTQFFVGPEIPGHPGFELDGQGGERKVTQYKVDEDEVKRQAARFRLFETVDGSGPPVPAALPPGATVEWTVHLVNKKGAIQRLSSPPAQPVRPQLAPGSAARLIDPGPRTIVGASAGGVRFDTGEFAGRRVPLGELLTDRNQDLLVLGGFGFSSSPTNAALPSFYTNPGWHDDSSDGPVTARVQLPDGTTIEDIAPAWVVVGPPDFAPEIQGVVTLYDILLQLGVERLGVPPPPQVSFSRHVFPLLHRTRRLQWVSGDPTWSSVSEDWVRLADPSAASASLRQTNGDLVLDVERVLSRYELTKLQKGFLERWVAGTFTSDWSGIPEPGPGVSAEGMTRAALEGTVGQGFFPGIEGGILLTDHTIYGAPFDFRLDHARLTPGDVTALMAVPWQADFVDCGGGWWPSQRPDDVRPNPNTTTTVDWERGANTRIKMVNNFAKLGFITAQQDDQGNVVFAEDQRAVAEHFL